MPRGESVAEMSSKVPEVSVDVEIDSMVEEASVTEAVDV